MQGEYLLGLEKTVLSNIQEREKEIPPQFPLLFKIRFIVY